MVSGLLASYLSLRKSRRDDVRKLECGCYLECCVKLSVSLREKPVPNLLEALVICMPFTSSTLPSQVSQKMEKSTTKLSSSR